MNAVEFSIRVLEFNENLPNELAALEAEGWKGAPGVSPMVQCVMFKAHPGKQPEFALKIIPFNDDLHAERSKLEKEGWVMMPGLSQPVTYVMFRSGAPVVVQSQVDQAPAGLGSMKIDDTKVHIIRDGKPVAA